MTTVPASRRIARGLLFSSVFAAGLYIALPTPSYAFDYASSAPVNLHQGEIAIKGYDPVAYFTDNAAIEGSSEFTATHDGATYQFASAANRDAFAADPARYAPAYGGFCAFGTSYGQKVDIDPQAFSIVDDTLYLNVNLNVRDRWAADLANKLRDADAYWPQIKDVAPNDL
ncbi:MAG: YHS domain-containing (seleno)protein [Pseudomonadota bacterium]